MFFLKLKVLLDTKLIALFGSSHVILRRFFTSLTVVVLCKENDAVRPCKSLIHSDTSHVTSVIKPAAITFCQARGYLPSFRPSPSVAGTSLYRDTVVERRSVTGELSLSYPRPAADGRPLMWVNHPLQGQPTRPTQPFIL